MNMLHINEYNEKEIFDPNKGCACLGAVSFLLGIDEAIPLIHGPIGCEFHLRAEFSRHINNPNVSFIASTQLDDLDVILGAERKLENAVNLLNTRLEPTLIGICSSCASNMIGEDLEGVAFDIKEHVDCEVLFIENCAGFKGDYTYGFNQASLSLIQILDEIDAEVQMNSVNLIGANIIENKQAKSDIEEISKLLNEIGIKINATLSCNTTIMELKELKNAEMNVVLSDSFGLETAQMLENRYSIPYIIPHPPYGYYGTLKFIHDVERGLNLSSDPNYSIRLMDQFKNFSHPLEFLHGIRAAVFGSPTVVVGICSVLFEIGIDPILVGFNRNSEYCISILEKLSEKVDENINLHINPDDHIFQKKIRESNIDIIFGNSFHLPVAKALDVPLIGIGFPLIHEINLRNKPYVCLNGYVELIQQISDVLMKKRIND